MKIRSDSVLFKLTDEQQAKIYEWLRAVGYVQTQKNIAASPPDGFGLKTHLASLHRFLHHYEQKLQEAAEFNLLNPDAGTARAVAEQNIAYSAFELATSPDAGEAFGQLSRWVHRQKDHELNQQQLALQQQRLALKQKKFEFEATREALNHFSQLKEIFSDSHKRDEDKFRALRDHFSGASATPDGEITRAAV